MYHYSQGQHTKQAHKAIPEGRFEEEQGLFGFFGPVSHLIKSSPSTNWTDIQGPLRPHMFDLPKLTLNEKPLALLHNSQVEISVATFSPQGFRSQVSYRNADGDSLYFCHKGEGTLISEYGALNYRKGDYLVVPKSLGHSFISKSESFFFIVENKNSHYQEPDRGMLGRNAIYDSESLRRPDLDLSHKILDELQYEICQICVKRLGEETTFTYPKSVYNTLGWKGDLYPFAINMDELMPVMSHRAHLPPSAHTTFVAKDFVVCSFVPRPLESDADALKVPFYHQNIDYDEVLFYHDGDFFSRDNLEAGMMSLHPAGFPHGPHPKAVSSVDGKTETNEYAVMVDTRFPLELSEDLKKVELAEYWKSWMIKE